MKQLLISKKFIQNIHGTGELDDTPFIAVLQAIALDKIDIANDVRATYAIGSTESQIADAISKATSKATITYLEGRTDSRRGAGGRGRRQAGGSLDKATEFYKSMLILILLELESNSKEFLEKLKAAMADAGQEDLVMDLLRRIIDKWLKIKATDYTISFTDLDQNELEGLEEAMMENKIVLKGDSLHVQAPEEFRDALGDQPYFLVGEGDVLHGLDEEVELDADEKKALAGGIPLTAVLAMYLVGLTHESFYELE